MSGADEAGAEATARYFLDLYAYVYATGDLDAWRELSHPECVFCASVIANVEEQVAAGHRSEGSQMAVRSLRTTEIAPGSRYGVEADVTQGASRELDAQGNVISERSQDQAALVVFALVYADGWSVREVDATAPTGS